MECDLDTRFCRFGVVFLSVLRVRVILLSDVMMMLTLELLFGKEDLFKLMILSMSLLL